MKKLICGIIAGTVLTSSLSVFAGVVKNIKASYNVNKLIVNGVDTGKGSTAFISGGTTYIPLRTVSDALGHSIKWDSSSKTIYINSSSTPTLEEPADIPSVSTTPVAPQVVTPQTPQVTVDPYNPANRKFISEKQARDIAIKTVGGGTVIFVKPDLYDLDDIPDYEVKVMKNGRLYKVEINALNGAVIDFELD